MSVIQSSPESLRSNQALRSRAQQEVGRLQQTQESGQGAVGQTGRADGTQLSDELLEEVGRSGQVDGLQEDQAIQAIQKLFESRAGDPQGGDSAKSQETKPVSEPKKASSVKRTAHWTPNTEEGQIVEGHGKIGTVEIKEEKAQPVDKPEKSQGTKSSHGPKQVGKAGQAAKQSSQSEKDEQEGSGQAETDKVELNPEAQQMLQKMSQQGIGSGAAQQAAGQPSKGEGKSESFDVTTRATGMNQTVKVQPKGEVRDDQAIRTFQRLDDMPLDESTGMKRVKGSDVADSLDKKDDSKKQVQEAGAAAGLDAQKQRLRSPVEN
jgi:hypothetical protein